MNPDNFSHFRFFLSFPFKAEHVLDVFLFLLANEALVVL